MHATRLILPLTVFAASLAGGPSGSPSLLHVGWQTDYRVASFAQDEQTAFVAAQSHERSSIVATSYVRSEFRVEEHAFRTDGAVTEVHAEAIPGTVWNLFPREQTGWLLLDGLESGEDNIRALWRLDMSGQVDPLESLPSALWSPSEGKWDYLASPDGLQVARIFHRYTFTDQADDDYVEALTGLTVPPLGLIVTFLDASSGAEIVEPVVLQAPNATRAGRPSAYPYWQTDGTLMLTDGVAYARAVGLDGVVTTIDVPGCLHTPTPRWVSQNGETLHVDRTTGSLAVGSTDEAPFGCPGL
jgi:hypothetical protein